MDVFWLWLNVSIVIAITVYAVVAMYEENIKKFWKISLCAIGYALAYFAHYKGYLEHALNVAF